LEGELRDFRDDWNFDIETLTDDVHHETAFYFTRIAVD
jgi:hypothetical protein